MSLRHSSRMSPRSCGEDVESWPKMSTLLVASMWSWCDHNDELNEMYGPSCWQGCDVNQGGFKKLMCYGIMKELNCKVTSSWSSCGRAKEMAFTHRQFGNEGERMTTQLDHIVGPRRTSDEA